MINRHHCLRIPLPESLKSNCRLNPSHSWVPSCLQRTLKRWLRKKAPWRPLIRKNTSLPIPCKYPISWSIFRCDLTLRQPSTSVSRPNYRMVDNLTKSFDSRPHKPPPLVALTQTQPNYSNSSGHLRRCVSQLIPLRACPHHHLLNLECLWIFSESHPKILRFPRFPMKHPLATPS